VNAVLCAGDLFDDPTRADEIVVRNNIRHPGFVPVRPLKVLHG
jgi:prophage DNA circulation protein